MRALTALLFVSAATLAGCAAKPPERIADTARIEPVQSVKAGMAPAEEAYQAGRLALDERNYGTAVTQFNRALGYDPRHVDAYAGLGVALNFAGRQEQSIIAFRKAVELAPENPGARTNLGLALLKAGEVDEARAEIERARLLSPNDERIKAAHASLPPVVPGRPSAAASSVAPGAAPAATPAGAAAAPAAAPAAPTAVPAAAPKAPPAPAAVAASPLTRVEERVYELQLAGERPAAPTGATAAAQAPSTAPTAAAVPKPPVAGLAMPKVPTRKLDDPVPASAMAPVPAAAPTPTPAPTAAATPAPAAQPPVARTAPPSPQARPEPPKAVPAEPPVAAAKPSLHINGFVISDDQPRGQHARAISRLLAERGLSGQRVAAATPGPQITTEIHYRRGFERQVAAIQAAIPEKTYAAEIEGLEPGVNIRLLVGRKLGASAANP